MWESIKGGEGVCLENRFSEGLIYIVKCIKFVDFIEEGINVF